MRHITTFDPIELKKLKIAYNKAVEDNRDEFAFGDQMLLTSYAKYLIEYLELKFGKVN